MLPKLEIFHGDANQSKQFEEIYAINQASPGVGPLDSIEHLKDLVSLSFYNLIAISNDRVVGFIICLRERSSYGSENYKFFAKKLKKFLYVDRVAIHKDYRRAGLGTAIYEDIFLQAQKEHLPVVLDVYTKPINQPSLNFHQRMGFDQIGTKDFHNHSVAYFVK